MATMAVLLMALAAVAGQGQNDRQAVQESDRVGDHVVRQVRRAVPLHGDDRPLLRGLEGDERGDRYA